MTDFEKVQAELRAGIDGTQDGALSRLQFWHDHCSPENIEALLDALDAAERERDKARSEALEEAARVADEAGDSVDGADIAEAIRALIKETGE